MDLQLQGKTAFISGSTSGIGYGCAKLFCKEGIHVILNGRTEASVQKAIAQLSAEVSGVQISGIATDFSSREEVYELLPQIADVDILVNNVGIYKSESFFESSDEDWYRQYEVNVMSGVRLSRKLLPSMIKRGWGRIIFVSSECATLVPEDLIAYSSTKTAIHAISRGLAQLTRGTAVTVNTVTPGSTMTEGAKDFLGHLATKEGITVEQAASDFFKNVRTSSLIERFVSVEEVASAIIYLASPLSAGTNGSTIKIDGGSMSGIL